MSKPAVNLQQANLTCGCSDWQKCVIHAQRVANKYKGE